MIKRSVLIASIAVTAYLLGIGWTQAPAQSGGKKKGAPAKDKDKDAPKTHKVEAKPFKIELSVKGALEANEATWIAHHPMPTMNLPYAPGPMTVVKVAEHGTNVKKGDLLIAFDTRKNDQAIQMLNAETKML